MSNLALAKTVSPQTANVGDLLTYTFTVTNNVSIGEAGGGPTGLATTGGLVTDTIPAGLAFVAPTPGSTCTDNPGPPETVTCDVGPVMPGAIVTASFIAQRDLGRGRHERHEHRHRLFREARQVAFRRSRISIRPTAPTTPP